MRCSKSICCQLFRLPNHRYRMTEIIKRLHAVYIHTYTFLSQKFSKLRISSSSFMSRHIERYYSHTQEFFQSFMNWSMILVQFKTTSVHCFSISSSFIRTKKAGRYKTVNLLRSFFLIFFIAYKCENPHIYMRSESG